jgi:hypothetical protein
MSQSRKNVISVYRLGGVFLAVVVTALLGVCGYKFAKYIHINNECTSDTRILTKNSHGDIVRMVSKVCGGFAYSSVAQLEVQRHNASRSALFFSYDSDSSEPHVTWTAPDTITVEIFEVSDVRSKLDNVNGINVRYEIGTDHRDARWLSQICLSSQSADIGLCTEYVSAVLIGRPDQAGFEHLICLPRRIPISDGVTITQQWLRKHQSELNISAHTVVRKALSSAFPCKHGIR